MIKDEVFFKPTQINSLIKTVEEKILEIGIQREGIASDLEAKRSAYYAIKEQDDKLELQAKEEEEILEQLVRLKTGNTDSKTPAKVYRSLSNATAHKDKKPRAERTPWSKYTKDVLADVKQPIFAQDIVDRIMLNYGKDIIASKDTQYQWKVRLTNLSTTPNTAFKADSKGRIGLKEWFDKSGVILPQYLKL